MAVDVPWHELTPCTPEPVGAEELEAHLVGVHGFPPGVLSGEDPADWAVWHSGEHSTRHPASDEPVHIGHLGHTHPRWVPKKRKTNERKAA